MININKKIIKYFKNLGLIRRPKEVDPEVPELLLGIPLEDDEEEFVAEFDL